MHKYFAEFSPNGAKAIEQVYIRRFPPETKSPAAEHSGTLIKFVFVRLTLAELPEPDCDHARFGHFSSFYTRKTAYFRGF